jgi:hypothetical protein
MKRLLIFAVASLIAVPAFAGTTQVKGYTRSDGTTVQSHTRSTPDSSRNNNLGSQSNGGSQRDEYSSGGGATNKSNSSYGVRDNDNDGVVNSLDRKPESKKDF